MSAKNKALKRIIFAVSAILILGAAVFGVFAVMSRTAPEIADDIDRHFATLDKYAPTPDDYKMEPDQRLSNESRHHVIAGSRNNRIRENATQKKERKRARSRNTIRKHDRPSPPLESESRWEGIRNVAPGTYVVDNALVTEAQKNPKQFIDGARASVHKRNGEPVGFMLKSIGTNNVLFAIGLRSGDILTAVNGHHLGSVDQALFAAAAVGSSRKFRVDILRNNQPRSLYYRVQ